MGHSVFGVGMQRLNIEAARRQAGQDLLQTPNPGFTPSAGSGTPISLSTPDILNSLIAITNPFFETTSLSHETENLGQDYDEPPEKKVFANLETPATTSCSMSTTTSQLTQQSLMSTIHNSNCSPLSIASTSTSASDVVSSPPPQQLALQMQPQPPSSIESMKTRLIKEGLKLTIQTKRKNSGKEELDVKSELVVKRPKREEVELTYDFSVSNDSNSESLPPTKLTAEDEERRKRRRERNKVAATKCRNKKKEKTVLLVKEAEVLEGDNVSLKSEIAQMEEEFKRLTALLASHTPTCSMNVHQKPSTSTSHQNQNQTQNQNHDQSHQNQNMMNSPYTASATAVHHDYGNHNQSMNQHLAISTHHNHNHNHFMGNNMNNMNYFNQIHHQPIQLS